MTYKEVCTSSFLLLVSLVFSLSSICIEWWKGDVNF
jgi:hypothetical protein